jgi:cbb3-type cytochrome oxidase subunit 3
MFLISLPAWTETVIVSLHILFLILAIVFVLKREVKSNWRVLLCLMCIFIPLFSLGYIIYALTAKKKISY